MNTLNAKKANERTMKHLLTQIAFTEGHLGKLLAKTGDTVGYAESMRFCEDLKEAIEEVFEDYYE